MFSFRSLLKYSSRLIFLYANRDRIAAPHTIIKTPMIRIIFLFIYIHETQERHFASDALTDYLFGFFSCLYNNCCSTNCHKYCESYNYFINVGIARLREHLISTTCGSRGCYGSSGFNIRINRCNWFTFNRRKIILLSAVSEWSETRERQNKTAAGCCGLFYGWIKERH